MRRLAGFRGFLAVALILVFGIGISDLAYATASTHIWAPSTDVQAFKKLHLTADFYFPSERDAAGNRPSTVTNEGLTIGVLPFKKFNVEVGFDHKTGTGDLDDYPMYFNAKAGIPEDSFGKFFPALAAGIYDAGTRNDRTDYNIWYVKGAKTLSLGTIKMGRFSVGYFNGNSKLLLDKNGEKDHDGVFAAWENTVKETADRLWLAVEYMGTESSYGSWNFGGAWKFYDNVSALLAYTTYNNNDLADTITLQIDIDF